jgi:4-amino-4-deoxy-L-arabinose transferase-like glycosyltransferase
MVPVAVAVLGLGLRLWNNGFGLPDTFGPDEPKMVNHALAFGLGDLNPHYFVYPALQMYLLFGVYGLLFILLSVGGAVGSVEDYKLLFLTDPSVFYRTGRAVTALFGAGSVLLVAGLGRDLFGSRAVGLLAALALALHPLAVLHGHYITADVPMTFFLLLSLIFSARLADRPSLRLHALSGAAAGLATATKYSGLIAVLPLAMAHRLGSRKLGRPVSPGPLLLAAACLALAFFSTSPFSVIEWPRTLEGMHFIFDVKQEGQFGVARGASWSTYLPMLFASSPLALAGLAGLLYALWRRTAGDAIVLALAVPYLLTIGGSQSHSPRYLVPLIPLLLLLAFRLVVEAWEATSTRLARRALALATGLALLVALGQSVALARGLGLPDTRTAARQWIEANVPAGATIAVEWGGDDTVRLRQSARSLEERRRRYESGAAHDAHNSPEQMATALRLLQQVRDGRPRYRVVIMGDNENNVLQARNQSLEELRALGVDYVVTSSAALGDPASEAFRRAYPDIAASYARLRESSAELARFESAPGRLRGPLIVVYRLPEAASGRGADLQEAEDNPRGRTEGGGG